MNRARRPLLVAAALLCVLCSSSPRASVSAGEVELGAASLVSVSGTIRHLGSPVAGVQVHVFWDQGSGHVTTGADGGYLVAGVATGGPVQVEVRPTISMGLAYRNWAMHLLTASLVKDFDLAAGRLLSGELRLPDGSHYNVEVGLNLLPHLSALPEGEWLVLDVVGGWFQTMVPPDVYSVIGRTPDYHLPRTAVELRSADVTGLVITLLAEPPLPNPVEPPHADRIQVGAPNAEGLATVTGSAGAVLPLSGVSLVSLNSAYVANAHSDAAGAFSATLFAPPGTSLWIKYDPTARATNQLWTSAQPGTVPGDLSFMELLPGTILTVGPASSATLKQQSFASSGAFGDGGSGWGGWWFTGTVTVPTGGTGPGLKVSRGEQVRVTGTVHFSSKAMNCSGAVTYTPRLNLMLRPAFDKNGWAEDGRIWFDSDLFTPTGLPVEREGEPGSLGLMSPLLTSLRCDGAFAFQGSVDATFAVPAGAADGTYCLIAVVDPGGMPLTSNAPLTVIWYNESNQATLPLLRVGSPAPARIPWLLLGDYPLNGSRGVVAREDVGHYAFVPRPLYPTPRLVVPLLDETTGLPATYRLEPGSNWLSSTDRRLPCPPTIPLALPSGTLTVTVRRPDGSVERLGPAAIRQSSVRTPGTPGGAQLHSGTGHVGDLFHLTTMDDRFAYEFARYGPHSIFLDGLVRDAFGNTWPVTGTYDVDVARILDLDPGQLPTTPYKQGDAFSPGLHVFPPVPAEVTIKLVQMPGSDPGRAVTRTITGRCNRFGYFQPAVGTDIRLTAAGEYRVDYTAVYTASDGTRWVGSLTWGNVIEGTSPLMEAHGRRGMDYHADRIDDMPAWFEVYQLPPEKVGIEIYYPYFSGDVHWGAEDGAPGDSIHTIITFKDKSSGQTLYNALRASWPRRNSGFRWPPNDTSSAGLEKRIAVGEAPLLITTSSGKSPNVVPAEIDQWGYWYGSSERPDVHVRELISEDNMGTAYWRFDDTYGYQIGEPSDGDHPGDLKWEFGGAVLRVPSRGITEYAIYSSLWVMLPYRDPTGARVTPPFQDATGASLNGGPILTLKGQDIDMLFLPKGVRPGDVLEVGDTVSFCGHVGPPLDSRVTVTITSASGIVHTRTWHASKVGWLYDPTFDFMADQAGKWTVDVAVVHDRPYAPNGVTPSSHNKGTVLGTSGRFEFYVVARGSPRLTVTSPWIGRLPWPRGVEGSTYRVEPIAIRGVAPPGATSVRYTIHDKGIVMAQGVVTPNSSRVFTITYDPRALHDEFPMLSLTAHEGRWEGLADEVAINLLALGGAAPVANTVTLISEEVFVGTDTTPRAYVPWLSRR